MAHLANDAHFGARRAPGSNGVHRARAFRWLISGAVGLALSGGIAALGEHALEGRDAATQTTDDTFCNVGNRRVRYLLAGTDKPGPTLVLVNGLGGSIEQWQALESLAKIAPVLAYDRGGYGFSDGIGAHDAEHQVEELHELLGALGLSGPFVVVAYSASALLVRLFEERYPELVAGLVFLDPVAPENALATRRAAVTCTLHALFGIMRLKLWWNKTPHTRREEKEQAIVSSFHHWLESTAELWTLGDWSSRLLSFPPLSSIPVGVATTYDRQQGEAQGRAVEKCQRLAQSSRGVFERLFVDHGRIASAAATVDFVARIEAHARGSN